jgi:hypothetical protein
MDTFGLKNIFLETLSEDGERGSGCSYMTNSSYLWMFEFVYNNILVRGQFYIILHGMTKRKPILA